MRARYYSPEMRRFVNADILAGKISNAVTLNRYAYANGNPVSNVDPFGLSAERGSIELARSSNKRVNKPTNIAFHFPQIVPLPLPIANPFHNILKEMSADDLFLLWITGDGSDQYFGDDSELAESLKKALG